MYGSISKSFPSISLSKLNNVNLCLLWVQYLYSRKSVDYVCLVLAIKSAPVPMKLEQLIHLLKLRLVVSERYHTQTTLVRVLAVTAERHPLGKFTF